MKSTQSIPYLDEDRLKASLLYTQFIPELKKAFQTEYNVPQRAHFDFENPDSQLENTLLLMPAWQVGKEIGVKLITVCPENNAKNEPAIQGVYILFDAKNGSPLAMMDAKALTKIRTAATSALASTFLSRANSSTLLVVGTGALAPELINAHTTVRPITQVIVWGRNFEKAKRIVAQFDGNSKFEIKATKNLEKSIPFADIISCATLSPYPLIKGVFVNSGQHIDLVGSFKPDMREGDDELIRLSKVFIDHNGATFESGDIATPLANGVLCKNEIKGDLFGLCAGHCVGRGSIDEITLFKSVGHALEDLAAAQFVFKQSPS